MYLQYNNDFISSTAKAHDDAKRFAEIVTGGSAFQRLVEDQQRITRWLNGIDSTTQWAESLSGIGFGLNVLGFPGPRRSVESPGTEALRRNYDERLQAKDARITELEDEVADLLDMIPVIEERSG